MTSTITVLDESKHDRHGILSVGGFLVEAHNVPGIETLWRSTKMRLGLEADQRIKYSMSWENLETRCQLIEAAGTLPIRAVIALLEDFRPAGMRKFKLTRKDTYIHRRAYIYVLQRLVENLYTAPGEGPHFVAIDHRDDFGAFLDGYEQGYRDGWTFGNKRLPSLHERGFSSSLLVCQAGPLHEIADLLTSAITRWADVRCSAHKGGKADDLPELERCARAVINLFPIGIDGVPPRRRGFSMVTHTKNQTGKELLRDNLDRWVADLSRSSATGQGDQVNIPF